MLGRRTKTNSCRLRGALPDRRCTPGAIYTDVGQVQLCTPDYVAKIRNRPVVERKAVFRHYGVPLSQRSHYTIDRLVPFDLGGSTDIANLWPEHSASSLAKDRVERRLYDLVCSNQLGLRSAQRAIASNWSALSKHV